MSSRAAAGVDNVVGGLAKLSPGNEAVTAAMAAYERFLHVLAAPVRVLGRFVGTPSVGARRLAYVGGTVVGIALTVLAAHVLGPHYYQANESDETYYNLRWQALYFLLFAGAGGVAGLIHALTLVVGAPGDRVIRWWWIAVYVVVHAGLCYLCVQMAPTRSPAEEWGTSDYRTDAFFGAFAFVPLGYAVIPIIAALAVAMPLIVGGLAFIFAGTLRAAVRELTGSGAVRRSWVAAGGHLVTAGFSGMLMFSIVELVTSFSFGSSFHGGRGSPLALVITTVLIGLGILPADGASWPFLLIAHLAAGCAVLMALGAVAKRLGRSRISSEP